jgi:hypothetical protein
VGAAKEKERRPISVLTNGLDSRFRSDDLRFWKEYAGAGVRVGKRVACSGKFCM